MGGVVVDFHLGYVQHVTPAVFQQTMDVEKLN